MNKTTNQKAWFFVLPVLALVAFNAIIPLMTVVNYSVQESFGANVFFWSGVRWFEEVLNSPRFHAALGRQLLFTFTILLIEVPLGVAIALAMPRKGPWVTVCLMDVWHWTSLVVLLAYAGLVSIPDAYYQAAKIDGARSWAIFRYIQLPKMKRVLTIAILLRFMDSFNIYTEPFVLTGGGPGNATTLLSIDLVKA